MLQYETKESRRHTRRNTSDTPLSAQPRHELVRGIASFLDARTQLDRYRNLTKRLVHPDDDSAQLCGRIEHLRAHIGSVGAECSTGGGRTGRPAAGFEYEIDGTATVDVYKVDTAREFSAENFGGRYHCGRFVSGKLDAEDGFRWVSTNQGPFLTRGGEERGSEAH